MPRPNPKKLSLYFDKRSNDFMVRFPSKPDGHLMHGILRDLEERPRFQDVDGCCGVTVFEELERRGYDMQSLRIEIMRKG